MAELPALIAATIDELKLTPLLLDSSSDDRVSAFLSYTCILADGASLALVGGKGGVRPSEVRSASCTCILLCAVLCKARLSVA
jgi:hypothetical protein